MGQYPVPPPSIVDRLREGIVIPAHPLALTRERKFDERRQRALTRYYHASGAGGIAVGVHTTQFAIREPRYGLLKPVLELASETITACDQATGRETVRIAGICGEREQALAEAQLACDQGYHVGLLSLSALKEADDDTLIEHCRAIAQQIPLMGFYLQPAADGRLLSPAFWRGFAEIPNVIAIKLAPFNRYHTLDVIHAVAAVGRAGEIALYTGNDDNIIVDLLTEFAVRVGEKVVNLHIVGGLLGHWACWTQKVVPLLEECKAMRRSGTIPVSALTLAAEVTDCNAAFFDAMHWFAGSIPGIHEVLRRQGLLDNILCLNPDEIPSPGQLKEIDRVYRAYPHLNDDDFVRENLHRWLN